MDIISVGFAKATGDVPLVFLHVQLPRDLLHALPDAHGSDIPFVMD